MQLQERSRYVFFASGSGIIALVIWKLFVKKASQSVLQRQETVETQVSYGSMEETQKLKNRE